MFFMGTYSGLFLKIMIVEKGIERQLDIREILS